MNKFLGYMKTTETIKAKGKWEIEGFTKETERKNFRNLKFYRNNNAITCVLESKGIKAIGIAKCNPRDKFNYYDGMVIAETRARENFYKIIAERHLERMKENNYVSTVCN